MYMKQKMELKVCVSMKYKYVVGIDYGFHFVLKKRKVSFREWSEFILFFARNAFNKVFGNHWYCDHDRQNQLWLEKNQTKNHLDEQKKKKNSFYSSLLKIKII